MAVIALVSACFFPWVLIESKNIIVTGVNSEGTNFGKPGYFHFVMAGIYLLLHFTSRVWAKRLNILIAVLNVAWAVRNYFLISACHGGECPEKKIALFVVVGASLLMMISSLFPKMDIPVANE